MSKRKKSADQSQNKVCEFPPDSKSEALKNLIKDSAYVCRACGRSAGSHESLCQPEKLYTAW